jgi:hypothetical protein
LLGDQWRPVAIVKSIAASTDSFLKSLGDFAKEWDKYTGLR